MIYIYNKYNRLLISKRKYIFFLLYEEVDRKQNKKDELFIEFN